MELVLAKNNIQNKNTHRSESAFHDLFISDVISGLTKENKSLPPKYFYDDIGSQYFDEICDLEEYYPYQTELNLLQEVASDLSSVLKDDIAIVEFGAGSLQKIQPLFDQVDAIKRYFPIDISGDFLKDSIEHLQKTFPAVEMQAIVADFTHSVALPEVKERKLGFFPGSTIGNFLPEQALDFLESCRKTLGQGARLLIGVDTKKSPEVLHRAYNDRNGITKKFNLNILERINRELDGNIDVDAFEHYAFYNANKGCIEMHLVSNKNQSLSISGVDINFSDGESIHTESSYKYTEQEFSELANNAGWLVEETWIAKDRMFSTYLLHNV